MHEKTGHDNKGMSGHGFTFPVGGSVPVIFISMGLATPRAFFEVDVILINLASRSGVVVSLRRF
jgi:hypothetical protein